MSEEMKIYEVMNVGARAISQLASSMEILAKAITYHADKVGGAADAVITSQIDEPGKAYIAPGEDEPVQELPSEKEKEALKEVLEVSDDKFRAGLNAYAKKVGKADTLNLVGKYAPSLNPLDIDQADRRKVMGVIANA